MATDSTELTFVRCPSCRSLVPAVSTRCRMCGAGLDASGEGEDLDREKKSGRVRQRTMSQPQSELNSAVSKLRASEGATVPHTTPEATQAVVAPPPVQPAAAPGPAAANFEEPESLEDPLSAYIEEVDEPDPSKTLEKQSPVHTPPDVVVEHNGNGHAAIEKPEMKAAPARPVEPSIPAASIITARPPVAEAVIPSAAKTEPVVSEPEGEAPAQRVIVESGLRRHGKPSGLSFSRGREEVRPQSGAHPQPQSERQAQPKPAAMPQPERQQPRQEQAERSERSERAEAVQFSREEKRERQTPPQQQVQPQRQREPERREPEKREPERREPERREPERREHQERREDRREHHERRENDRRDHPREKQERNTQPVARAAEGTKRAEQQAGRLFGWLVNYSHPDGVATELREGKFFVTASSLKSSDLIVDDPSISTPHALVSVTVDLGLQVQDLMSDRGVFIRRRGDDSYRRESDVARVEHGDWLRFGDVEYLVSLIAHVGVK